MKLLAVILYFITSALIYFPIAIICVKVDVQAAMLLFSLLLIKQSSQMYLGVK